MRRDKNEKKNHLRGFRARRIEVTLGHQVGGEGNAALTMMLLRKVSLLRIQKALLKMKWVKASKVKPVFRHSLEYNLSAKTIKIAIVIVIDSIENIRNLHNR